MKFDLYSAIIAVTVLILFLLLQAWRKKGGKHRAAIRFSSFMIVNEAGKSWRIRFRWIPGALRLAALVFFLIGFARPQKGLEVIQTAKEGIAIQMVIDRSSSMKAPLTFAGRESDRLAVVKQVLEKFILGNQDELKGRRNDMIGLISFAGYVEENAPLTLDHGNLVSFARTIPLATRLEDGTMIGDALYYSTLRLVGVDELLKKSSKKNDDFKVKSKVIILLTDGQQTRGGKNPIEAAHFAKENDIKVYTIAIVDSSNYRRQDSPFGQFFSLLNRPVDTSIVEEIASITGGKFAKADSGEALLKIYQQIDELEKTAFDESFTTYKENFTYFVFIGLFLIIAELILSQTLFRKIP